VSLFSELPPLPQAKQKNNYLKTIEVMESICLLFEIQIKVFEQVM
jgi:hypothetical protein